MFAVESLVDARMAATRLGGALNPVEQEWQFEGTMVCDGHDPEGNVFQLRTGRESDGAPTPRPDSD